MRTKLFLKSTEWINVDKSTLNQCGYHVDRLRDIISTYINVESTLSICWDWLIMNY